MRKIEEFESVISVLGDLAKETRIQYKSTLRQFLQFLNSNEGLTREVTPDDLIEEAKRDIDSTQKQIDNFYKWLQGEKIEGHRQGFRIFSGKKKPIKVRSSTAHQRAYSCLRGFYVNNDIAFNRKWIKKIPRPKAKSAIKKDGIYSFYKVNEEKREIYFDRELMRQFLSNLKLRDQAIALALLSSSQDTGGLLGLNVGDIREQSMSNRIYWESNRDKTGTLFKTFFSKEATQLIRRYITQERKDAKDDEPLFVVTKGNRMNPKHLSSVYRDAAKKMGVKWGNGEHNPLRPKRMRHLFRTACDTVGVSELYKNMFMGHKNSMGMDYSEVSRAKAELEYLRVEPFLTVYGEVEEATEIKEEMSKLRTTIDILMKKNVDLTERVERFEAHVQRMIELEKKIDERLQAQNRIEWEK